MQRTGVTLVLGLAMSLVLGAPATVRAADVAVVVAEGRGWGHGVGLAQDGAFAMGADGATMDQILDHFYPGVGRGSAVGVARVLVHVAGDGVAQVRFPDGGELRSPRSGPQHPGFPVRVGPGGVATVRFDGSSYVVEAAGEQKSMRSAQLLPSTTSTSTTTTSSTSTTTTTTSAPLLPLGPTTTSTTIGPGSSTTTTTTAPGPPPAGPSTVTQRSPEPVWAGPVSAGGTVEVLARGIRYRGEVELARSAEGGLRVVNELDVEQYLWGLGEVSASWSPGALRAQIVAARTYALRAMRASGEICDTQRCQVYKGVNGEFAQQVQAVNDTLGTVLTWNGAFASTVYSANAAGVTATPSEGFGNPDAPHPYLPSVRYPSRSDVRYEVPIALADLAARLGYAGTATSARVASTGPSGRPLTVELDGDAGTKVVRAIEVQRAMGLQSTQWTLRLDSAAVAPAAPKAADVVQAAPDDVAAAVAAESKRLRARAARASDRTTTTMPAGSGPTEGGDDDGLDPLAGPLVVAVLAAGVLGLATLRRS